MAAITASNVTILTDDTVGTASNKRIAVRRRLSIALTAQGGTAGDIPASVLGFNQLYSATLISFVIAGPANANIGVTLDTWGSNNNIVTFTAVDGSTAPANVTGTLYVDVVGDAT
jgi:hypothetical protein